ncbi:Aromatic-L-amino-acid decarboxylase [Oleidesulfovibrio alaskensis G20]|jgi:aromatic-L-amino-acid decarboxylase|uniref:Aromatic-L-amino-acid decarboxylase n=1 Tax=Oleidesulfovibrio alaskensis (strain ATCC BAA-1058 / DSM 17464 / G20) TaxID=207559 RepID=Q313H1_OLEA2|nr:pyridoxal-dependent decarboxylase [Oleidesulfovibrio alaskensis]ABB37925.1 Aromatic-L-amino-acid decarboxylase [Oleidesulfovibrio alaskensis G20]MBG0772922.1 amino acid decarboxylase [Oleidesulfovibrio alaskensis]MBL3582522.1 amino acid decarboxylase [Oleidesulfovibrio alaskensis]
MTRKQFETLDLDNLEQNLQQAAELIAGRIRAIACDPVKQNISFEELAAIIPCDLPDEGHGPEAVIGEVARHIEPYSTRIGHPRFLAWITTSPGPAGTIGDMLCTGLNQAPLSFKGGPAATVLEEIVLGWFAGMFGMPEGWGGTIVSGGTMANLMGLTVARRVHAPQVHARGMQGLERPLVLYVSDQGHMSVTRSAVLLGIGEDNVRAVPSDSACRMIPHELEKAVQQDRRAGRLPFCVVAQAGSVTTGAVDPLPDIAAICRRENMWMHVDAAYGGAVMLADELRPLLAGIELADSVCVDPHKWFFVPLECGITLFRSREQQLETFRAKAAYLGAENPHDLKNTTFILSRANRALKVWFAFRSYGRLRIARIIRRNMELARQLYRLMCDHPEWEPLAPAPLSIVCGRYTPSAAVRGGWTEQQIDDLQLQMIEELERSGTALLTPAAVNGRAGVRVCIANHRTTPEDITLIFNTLTAIGTRIARPDEHETAGE